MTRSKKLAIAAVLIVLGVILMVMPTPGEPEVECADPGGPTSGFTDEDQGGCPISIESFREYTEWSSGPRWDNIAGLVLVVLGLGYGGVALIRKPKRATEPDPAGDARV
ncbi:hypothetical protein [Nocardioides aurantiacus]|uniref:Uncharacterized protein n=1 Tax=Nocardioides aurantiacus TaxID=86796 RepID=A0A3N2CTA3_9ACTN|nr:hypothetical protein [Nocardioides aurantiacus]ROR90767.1 hypothetical protein EDD33_1615 [Nocardioides aurantiacus]